MQARPGLGRESTNGHAQKSRRLGVSMAGKPKRMGMRSLSSEWMGESREWEPAESIFLLAEGGAGRGSGDSRERRLLGQQEEVGAWL